MWLWRRRVCCYGGCWVGGEVVVGGGDGGRGHEVEELHFELCGEGEDASHFCELEVSSCNFSTKLPSPICMIWRGGKGEGLPVSKRIMAGLSISNSVSQAATALSGTLPTVDVCACMAMWKRLRKRCRSYVATRSVQ